MNAAAQRQFPLTEPPQCRRNSRSDGQLGKGGAEGALTADDLATGSVGASEIGTDGLGAIQLPGNSINCNELVEITQVVEPEDVVNNANATVTATCPANTDVVSAGLPSPVSTDPGASRRSGNRWTARARDIAGAPQLVTAIAARPEPWE